MTVQARLTTKYTSCSGCSTCCITTNGQLAGEDVAVEADAKDGEEHSKVPADIVKILLGVYKLFESSDTVM